MPPQNLQAPWRMEYLRSIGSTGEPGPCFLCAAAAAPQDQWKQLLVLWRTEKSIVLINRFPYSNGHLMVAPLRHLAELDLLDPAESADMHAQTILAIRLLKRAISPQGFNLGINLGRCAGAGLPGHVHQHIVPRWNGDVNFMSVVGDVRVVPQANDQLYDELMTALAALHAQH
jgi:ATP adenylyltransferase